MNGPMHKIGIICAIDEECGLLVTALMNKKRRSAGPVTIIEGMIGDIRIAIAAAGIGKVNAAIGTMSLIADVKALPGVMLQSVLRRAISLWPTKRSMRTRGFLMEKDLRGCERSGYLF
jgi:hypothetical protein